MDIIRILAVDDHEMTTMGYKFILEDSEFEDFKVQKNAQNHRFERVTLIN